MKKYIAFDTSSSEIIVCGFNGKSYYEKRLVASGTEHIMVLLNEVLKKLKMDISEVDVIGVGVGPGSWTGSRVSVVTAYGLLAGLKNKKVVTFNTFELISYNDNEKDGKIYLHKAYANFVYASVEGGEPIIITTDELASKYASYKKIGFENFIDGIKVVKTDIKSVVEGKIMREGFSRIEEVEPIYLRLSQAEYQYMEKHKGDIRG